MSTTVTIDTGQLLIVLVCISFAYFAGRISTRRADRERESYGHPRPPLNYNRVDQTFHDHSIRPISADGNTRSRSLARDPAGFDDGPKVKRQAGEDALFQPDDILRKRPRSADPTVPERSDCSGIACTLISKSKPQCFRITNIPGEWGKDQIENALVKIDPGLQERWYRLTISDDYNGYKTAAIVLPDPSEYFMSISSDRHTWDAPLEGRVLGIDRHFRQITPLYTPSGEIAADVVAITGLAGHAYGSWCSRQTHEMWLKDYLPKEIPNIRVMTYGFDSYLMGERRSEHRLSDFTATFLRCLELHRDSAKKRPLILICHSLGGIIVASALVQCHKSPGAECFNILDSLRGLFFFGTPHNGLRTKELEHMVDDYAETYGQSQYQSIVNLLQDLEPDSEYLRHLRQEFKSALHSFNGKIVSFYERASTNTMQKSESSDKWQKKGPRKMMVAMSSAILGDARETIIPVDDKDHSDMVKFSAVTEYPCPIVIKHLRECVCSGAFTPGELLKERISQIRDGSIGSKELLQVLRCSQPVGIPYDVNESEDLPKFYWVFKDCDFRSWYGRLGMRSESAEYQRFLWISRADRAHLKEISMLLVEKLRSRQQELILHFSCKSSGELAATGIDDIDEQVSATMSAFSRTVLSQIVEHLELRVGQLNKCLLALFFESLTMERGAVEFIREQRSETSAPIATELLETLLNFPHRSLLRALEKAMLILLNEHSIHVILVLDGLEGEETIEEFHKFVLGLLQKSLNFTAVATCLPASRLQEILQGFLCISFDVERQVLLGALRVTNDRYETAPESHLGSLEWLWDHVDYVKWQTCPSSSLLYCEGKPGSGKSTLCKFFHRRIKGQATSAIDVVASYFYSRRDGRVRLETSHVDMLRYMLWSILEQKDEFFYHFQKTFRQLPGSAWTYIHLRDILKSIGGHTWKHHIYLVVDALDESDMDERRDLIETLIKLTEGDSKCVFKIFLASRPINQLRLKARRSKETVRMIILQHMTKGDIHEYARAFLSKLQFPDHLVDLALTTIDERANGVFVWVHLVKRALIQFCENGFREAEIVEYLRCLPQELQDLYSLIIKDLETRSGHESLDTTKIFRILLHARRLVRVEELRHALAVSDDPRVDFKLDCSHYELSQHLLDPHSLSSRILHCCGNLVEFKHADESAEGSPDMDYHIDATQQTVQFMHETVRVFFIKSAFLQPSIFAELVGEEEGNARLATVCLRYIGLLSRELPLEELSDEDADNSKLVQQQAEQLVTHMGTRPWMNYALSFLQDHLNSAGANPHMRRLVSEISEISSKRSPLLFLLAQQDWGLSFASNRPPMLEPYDTTIADEFRNQALHCAVAQGLTGLAEALVRCGAQINFLSDGYTPLMKAIALKDPKTIRMLIMTGANGAIVGEDGTALHVAALCEYPQAIRLIATKRSSLLSALDQANQTPLHIAARTNEQPDTIATLVEYGADCVQTDSNGRIALHNAVEYKRPHLIPLLVERTTDCNLLDGNGFSPLHVAAAQRDESVLRILLDLGCDPTVTTSDGNTALHHAVIARNLESVELLLHHGVSLASRNRAGYCPIHLAALCRKGSEAIVKRMLDKDPAIQGAIVDADDNKGKSVLHLAAEWGNTEVVKLLAHEKANIANIEHRCANGHTPLHLGVMSLYPDVIQVLLDAGSNIEAEDNSRRRPLHLAVGYSSRLWGLGLDQIPRGDRQEWVLPLLNLGALVDVSDLDGLTPLHLAAAQGSDRLVELFLAKGARPTRRNNLGQTARDIAASTGHEGILRLLMDEDSDSVGANPRDRNGTTDTSIEANESGARIAPEGTATPAVATKEWLPDVTDKEEEDITNEQCRRFLTAFIENEKPGLRVFYPDEKDLDAAAAVGAKMIKQLLIMGCPKELALMLSVLTLYDLVLLLDDCQYKPVDKAVDKRIILQACLTEVATIYTLARSEGILSVKFLKQLRGRSNLTGLNASGAIVWPRGPGFSRRIDSQLRNMLQHFVYQCPMKKPLLVMIIANWPTAEEPDDSLEPVITDCFEKLRKNEMKGKSAVSLSIACIRDDHSARETSDNLRRNPRCPPDQVYCLPEHFPLEHLRDGALDGVHPPMRQDHRKWKVLERLFLGVLYRSLR